MVRVVCEVPILRMSSQAGCLLTFDPYMNLKGRGSDCVCMCASLPPHLNTSSYVIGVCACVCIYHSPEGSSQQSGACVLVLATGAVLQSRSEECSHSCTLYTHTGRQTHRLTIMHVHWYPTSTTLTSSPSPLRLVVFSCRRGTSPGVRSNLTYNLLHGQKFPSRSLAWGVLWYQTLISSMLDSDSRASLICGWRDQSNAYTHT